MKKTLTLTMLLVLLAFSHRAPQAQTNFPGRNCPSGQNYQYLLQTDPEFRRRVEQIESFTRNYTQNRAARDPGARDGVIIIPVVVHVVYNTTAQNVSDAQVQNQLDILNADFGGTNTDIGSVPAAFQPLAANARIRFQLAARDPNCNMTNGITRTSTTVTSFTVTDPSNLLANNPVKAAATGGQDAWPSDQYLNIWVCNLSAGLLGYSSFPGFPANVDGVVIDFQYFGNTGVAGGNYNLGRTATHEIGHWLNLFHIWGDDGPGTAIPDSCAGSDLVNDTPNQALDSSGCPTFPTVSCSNGPNGNMHMNYMDYTDDRCMYMFSNGQSVRIDATLYGPRSSIVGSSARFPPSTSGADLWSQDTPEDTGVEANTISPVMYQSDDIWVRRQNDGLTSQEHQSPIYRSSGAPNYVYVRIRNKTCSAAGTGTVKLYWAKASSGLSWPSPWDGSVTSPALMGSQIGSPSAVSVVGGGFTILEFPWNPPNPNDYASFGADRSHFCLLSRIETSTTPPFGMTTMETGDLNGNVGNNNNIVWKNVEVSSGPMDGGREASVLVANFSPAPYVAKLVFDAPARPGQPSLFQWGTVTIDLGTALAQKLKAGGTTGKGVRLKGNKLTIDSGTDAWIGNIQLEPKELHSIKIRFNPRQNLQKGNRIFNFNLTQYASDGSTERVIGGQRFAIKTVYDKKQQRHRCFFIRLLKALFH